MLELAARRLAALVAFLSLLLMAFHVPVAHEGLFGWVERQFRLLLAKHVVTGISELQFDKWVSNFYTEEDRYLAARLLENLTFRSQDMVGSALAHILQCIVPSELRRMGQRVSSLEQFIEDVASGSAKRLLRFVEVAGHGPPGKSGAVLMRELHRVGHVHNAMLCRADGIKDLPASVECLVFVDDMLGTGTQFMSFARESGLAEHAKTRRLISCPLAAFEDGLQALADACPWLLVCPVETFGPRHRFFRGEIQRSEVWAIDGQNLAADVREYMTRLCNRAGITVQDYCLELVIGFHNATPNNTLPVMYWNKSWHHLLVR